MKVCPKCSYVNSDSVTKCAYCEYEFSQADASFEETAPISEPEQSTYTAPVQNPVPPTNYGTQNNNYQYNQQNQYNPNGQYSQYGGYNNVYGAPQTKYCPHCGNQCDPLAVICVNCGAALPNSNNMSAPTSDIPSTGMKILSFFIPLVGLILYITEKDKHPVSAKAYGKMALISFIIGCILTVIYVVLVMFVYGTMLLSYDDPYEYYDYYYSMINLLGMLK